MLLFYFLAYPDRFLVGCQKPFFIFHLYHLIFVGHNNCFISFSLSRHLWKFPLAQKSISFPDIPFLSYFNSIDFLSKISSHFHNRFFLLICRSYLLFPLLLPGFAYLLRFASEVILQYRRNQSQAPDTLLRQH